MNIKKILWGSHEGKDIYLLTLTNGQMDVSITNFGCAITSVNVPDGNGKLTNIVLGYASLSSYINDTFYMGSIIGRVANRISYGTLPVKGYNYQLTLNEPDKENHLHGGFTGFNKKVFSVKNIESNENAVSVTFGYQSTHMEEGYPGNLDVLVSYELNASNEFTIAYNVSTDESTHVNLTNHTYFNLSGTKMQVLDHRLLIKASRYLVNDGRFIPTGEVRNVSGTVYDFTRIQRIDERWDRLTSNGYNTFFILDHNDEIKGPHAELTNDTSGITVAVSTSLPGILLYTGDYLTHTFIKNQGICLETQFFPDAPNKPDFPSTLLHPGQDLNHRTTFTFGRTHKP